MEAKLAVSSIAWQQHQENDVAKLLQEKGVHNVEIAPTKVWGDKIKNDPLSVTSKEIDEYLTFWDNHGIKPVAMQSMLFLRPDLHLFDDDTSTETIEYLHKFIILSGRLGVQRMVFGSPKNRLVNTNLTENEQSKIAIEIFTYLGSAALKEGVIFCIEPNPESYGCNFVVNANQGRTLVKKVNSAGFALHLDAAGMTLANDDPFDEIIASADVLQHFHVSDPYLNPVQDDASVNHGKVVAALNKIGYDKIVSVEMKPGQSDEDNTNNVSRAVEYVQGTYAVS